MSTKKRVSKETLLKELNELLFAGEGNAETEGLLTFARRMLPGDSHQAKIARVVEIVDKL